MQVIYDYNVFTRAKRNGISRYFCAMIEAARLENKGDRFEIVAPIHGSAMLHDLEHKPRRVRIKLSRYSRLAANLVNEALLERVLRRDSADILHETHYSGRNYAKLRTRPVYTVHDLTPEIFADEFRTYGKILAKRAYAFRSDAHFIAISSNTAEDLKRLFGVSSERIRVIHHGTSNLSAAFGVTRREDLLLFVGVRPGYKNFSTVVEAFARTQALAKNVELLAFGGGAFSPAESHAIAAAGIRRARQEGGDDIALARAYAEATVFIYPSHSEGFGLPLLEAMALGCPVACSRASCLPEIAGPAAAYFDPHRPDEIGAVLSTLFAGADQRITLAAIGTARQAMFSWERSAREHVALYREILQ